MPKVIALMNFVGADFAEKFEEGKTYDLEGARAQSLALRGLVKPLESETPKASPKEEKPKVEEPKVVIPKKAETKEVSQADATEKEAPKRIGRPRKTE